jgi:hypothetical protein
MPQRAVAPVDGDIFQGRPAGLVLQEFTDGKPPKEPDLSGNESGFVTSRHGQAASGLRKTASS